MSYEIDSSPVNDRIDWRYQPNYPGLTERTQETFPGDATVYLGVGELLPEGVIITGYIEADTIGALHTALKTERARTADTTLSTVQIHGITFNNQHLARFDPIGPHEPFRVGGATKRRRLVRYVWQGVRP